MSRLPKLATGGLRSAEDAQPSHPDGTILCGNDISALAAGKIAPGHGPAPQATMSSSERKEAAKLPVSAFIITRNEENRLPRCLEALAPWVGEIIVVDSGSTDRTVEIAEAHGAEVLYRAWEGYGQQKHFAEQRCRYDWVLNVDADEVVTPELASEIGALVDDGQLKAEAYRIRILTVYPGQDKPRPWANDYNVVRFYHRSIGSYSIDPVYDRVDIGSRRPQQLRAPIYHYTHISIAHAAQKAASFGEFRAKTSRARPVSLLKLRVLLEFPMVFLKAYIGRRHFTGGWQGYYFALCQAFMRTTRIALMLERQQGQNRPPPDGN